MLPHQRRPGVAARLRLVQRAARHQPAHAVAEDRRSPRSGTGQACCSACRRSASSRPVGRDMAAAVVVQVQQRAAGLGGQRRAVVVAVAAPLPRRACTGRAPAAARAAAPAAAPAASASAPQRRGPGRRGAASSVMASGLPVAARWSPSTPLSAAITASRSAATGSADLGTLRCAQQRHHLAQQRVEAAAHQPRDTADAAVDQPGDAAGGLLRRRAQRPRHAQDVVVQVLDQAGQAQRGVHRQAAGAAQVAGDRRGRPAAAGVVWVRSCRHHACIAWRAGPDPGPRRPAVPRSRRRCSPVRPAAPRCARPTPAAAGAAAGAAPSMRQRQQRACGCRSARPAPLASAGTRDRRQAAGGEQVRVVEQLLRPRDRRIGQAVALEARGQFGGAEGPRSARAARGISQSRARTRSLLLARRGVGLQVGEAEARSTAAPTACRSPRPGRSARHPAP